MPRSYNFASVYVAALVVCIAMAGTVFGLVVNNVGEQIQRGQRDTPSVSSLLAVVSAIQSLWAAIAILIVFLIARGLISISDDLVRIIFQVIAVLVLLPLNIWLLVDGILVLTNSNNTDNVVMSNTIYIMLIITGVISIITSGIFLIGLVAGFLH